MNIGPTPQLAPESYADWSVQLKSQIAKTRQRAALAINAALVQLYARIGPYILQH